jgi:hypothetical protein
MKAEEIKTGFKSPWWTALADAKPYTPPEQPTGLELVSIHVRFPDGGDDFRFLDRETEVPSA